MISNHKNYSEENIANFALQYFCAMMSGRAHVPIYTEIWKKYKINVGQT
jgi:hypothetical protein